MRFSSALQTLFKFSELEQKYGAALRKKDFYGLFFFLLAALPVTNCTGVVTSLQEETAMKGSSEPGLNEAKRSRGYEFAGSEKQY